MGNKIKIIFFGTPKFAKIILQKLIEQNNLKICAVVTAPDKLVGRKQILTPPAVKVIAQENNIPILQPEKLDNNLIIKLKKYDPDLHIIASYGKIIPQAILDLPKYGNLNVHPSLLPKYRGASPIQSVLLNGEQETGVTLILMDEKMDHGPILTFSKLPVAKDIKFLELHNKLAKLGAELLVKAIPDYISGKIKPIEQKHNNATFCKIIKKTDGKIDWLKPAKQIYNQWRAFCEWPGVYSQFTLNNKQLTIKFIEFKIPMGTSVIMQKTPGKFFVQNKKLYIVCGGKSALEIKKLQPEGKKIMGAQAFINGYLQQH